MIKGDIPSDPSSFSTARVSCFWRRGQAVAADTCSENENSPILSFPFASRRRRCWLVSKELKRFLVYLYHEFQC